MLRLETFGGLVVREDGVPHQGVASQRRRLALVVMIAAAGKRPISRDKLLGYLWPDTDAERARHALTQSLYTVQRALHTDALFLGTASLALNPAVISSDLADFDEAMARGAHERAAGLYTGPFLDGFHLTGPGEFERWMDTERARLARANAAALQSLATAALAQRDYVSAAKWWRRAVAADPLSSPSVMGLMQALTALGDRAGALRVATVHATLIREELDAPPDPAVTALEAQLRSGAAVTLPTAGAAAEGRPARPSRSPREHDWVEKAFAGRLLIEERPRLGGVTSTFAAYDRSRGIAVELNLVDPSLVSLANEDVVFDALERTRALDDPHIVPMYEYGWIERVLFYILARPRAQTLREHLKREPQLPIAEAVEIADGIAAALAHAHARSVHHGDLRPKHVLLAGSSVMVKSFGIAAAITASTRQPSSLTPVRFGEPAYLSPEQLAGDDTPDTRTDIYALGCILYQMLAGEVPFASSSHHTLIGRRLTQPPPSVRGVRDSVPPELDALLRRCLARLPSDRFRTVAALRDALPGLRAAV